MIFTKIFFFNEKHAFWICFMGHCIFSSYKNDTWEKLSHHFLYIFMLCNFWPSYSPCALCSVLAFSIGKWKWKSLNPDSWWVHGIPQARILEWVAIPFSRESSHPRDQTQVSCIAGRFLTSWATREGQEYWSG